MLKVFFLKAQSHAIENILFANTFKRGCTMYVQYSTCTNVNVKTYIFYQLTNLPLFTKKSNLLYI